MTYKLISGPNQLEGDGDVVKLVDSEKKRIAFKCPCGKRHIHIASPPHEISFDDDMRLTLNGSVGFSKHNKGTYLDWKWHEIEGDATNWCHFYIKDGEPEMCSDARCPGKDL